MKRQITRRQEWAYRLIHPSFGGMSHKQAAIKMNITERKIYGLLERMQKIAPQLFPILSAKHVEIWHLYSDEGLSCEDIANIMDTTERSVQQKLCLIKKKMGDQTHQRQIFNIDHIDETKIVQNF